MLCSDCLLVVTMEICHVCCYYTEGSEKPAFNTLIENSYLMRMLELCNECMRLQVTKYCIRQNATSAVKKVKIIANSCVRSECMMTVTVRLELPVF